VSYGPYAATYPRQSENRLPQRENYQAGHILSIKNDLVDDQKRKSHRGTAALSLGASIQRPSWTVAELI
jgi:hypothetical protein